MIFTLIKTNKKGASNYFSYKKEVLGRKTKVSLRERTDFER